MKTCELCGKKAKKLKELFGKQVCLGCVSIYEVGDDIFELNCLKRKRGKEWIIKHL